ncbi:hypothetical protein [Virgibacillus sp. L01]|uniref:hypothetical protein n=1 Tax=Virgibacillus sp. L01 TaxID=3457429 RepID=UPI003FD07B19
MMIYVLDQETFFRRITVRLHLSSRDNPENRISYLPVLAEKKKDVAKREAKMKESKQTGEKAAIRRWQENCNNSRMDCDLDNMTEFALPDGTTKNERRHTGLKG